METNVRKKKHKKYIYPKTWKITALKQSQHEKQLRFASIKIHALHTKKNNKYGIEQFIKVNIYTNQRGQLSIKYKTMKCSINQKSKYEKISSFNLNMNADILV